MDTALIPTAPSRDLEFRAALDAFIQANGTLPTFQAELHHLLANAPCTDVGNALRLYARHGGDLHWVSDWGVWLVWNGKVWARDEYGLIMRYAKEMTGYIWEEATSVAPATLTTEEEGALTDKAKASRKEREETAERLRKWALSSQSKGKLEGAIELLKSEPGITVKSEQLDALDNLLNFSNGTLDLETLEFSTQERAHLITKLAGTEYNPAAGCPGWEEFVTKVCSARPDVNSPYTPRPDLEEYIQAVCGCGLYGKILDEALVIFHGHGGNGKTVYVELVKQVMGDYCATATSDLFTAKNGSEGISNDIARLVGVRFLSASETQEGKFLDEALVKGLTGGDRKTARFLRQEFFEFLPKFTPVLLTNYPPVIKGTDNGIWRRLKLVPWDYDFTTDPQREDKPAVMARLAEEGPGIMNWLIKGLLARFNASSLEKLEPGVVRAATDRYRDDSDVLGTYIKEHLWVELGETLDKDALYKDYAENAKAGGFNALSKRSLGSKLMLRGWKDRKGTGGKRLWVGWRFRTDEDIDPEEPGTQGPTPVAPTPTVEDWEVVGG